MHRALRSAVIVLLPLLAAGAAAAGAEAPAQETVTSTTFVLRGRGWGHGVGMGQWGAYGQARRGVRYAKILAHYYPGTRLTTTRSEPMRVLLREGSGPYAVSSEAPLRLTDGEGQTYELDAGTVRVGKSLAVALEPEAPPTPLPGPLTFRPAGAPLAVGGKPYRGSIVVQRVERRLQVVNVVGLDAYLRGVVSEEVPDDWPLEAIKAQAVAARSYALAERQSRAILYADTRSQVYGGIAAETKAGDAAVAATKGQVLTFGGKVATTFFFASSGGRTADVEDVFAGGTPVPYLVAVPDPDDKVSPYHRWGPVVLPAGKVSKQLGIDGVTDLRTIPAGGRAREVAVTGRAGEKRLPASAVRQALDLRSTWFTPGVLTLSRPAEPLAPGQAVSLTGSVRAVKGPLRLEQKVGSAWSEVAPVAPAADGSFSVEVAPSATTWYRLTAADGVVSVPLRVPVAAPRRSAVSPVAVAPAAGAMPVRSTFVPTDPLALQQWHLARVRAFDFWPVLPLLEPVTVAVIDTGVDLGHPDLADNVLFAKSFVGGSADDPIGHGTFVSGLIAAEVDNGIGVAGIAFPARLLVARVATADGAIDAGTEAKAIRWAVSRGARVINLSLGGLRDPRQQGRDTFSQEEADAVAYARSRGVVVVAAVGNGDTAPRSPWPFASYPAALPHVIGVSSVTQSGAVPAFSNRDAIFNDLAAPGQSLVSTAPRSLTAARPSCIDQGYSPCGPADLRDGSGTSFSAAQVTAAAALLLAVRPSLKPDQVAAILSRTAVDAKPGTGCPDCRPGRDARSGWGMLDVTAALEALAGPLPPADRYEANDDAGARSAPLYGREITAQATLDFWDDQVDVYRVKLRAGERLSASLRGPQRTETKLALWRPGTEHVEGLSPEVQSRRLAQSKRSGPNQAVSRRVDEGGWYYVQVKMTRPGAGAYTLRISKSR